MSDTQPIHPMLEQHVKQDRRVTWVLVLSAIVAVLVLLGTPAVISTSNTTQRVVEGNEVAACARDSSATVTEARTAFDVARSERDTAATHLEVLTNQGLAAAVTDDDATFKQVLAALPEARQAVLDAEEVVVARTRDLDAASHQNREQIRRSIEDPRSFLAGCRP